MADIFQQELDSPDEQEPSNENTTTEVESEDKSKENNDQVSNANNEWEVELDNLYYFQSQPAPTLEELANSDYIHNRQLAAKKILESLQRAGSNQEELQSIISVMCKLSEDEECIVRSELVQHIPSIALFCQGHPSGLKLVIQQQLVPYTVKLLNDPQIAVRKLAQSALLVLLENNLIGQLQLSEWICPLIAQLAMCESNLEEQRIEDVTVMSMMIPLVGKDMAIKFFLEPYLLLCCDQAFGIRTVCAMRFGTLCKIAGTETTELSLLPSFLNLCCDDLWGVRKACADVFVDVASVVSLKTRKEVLPHIFINLLNDASRYVENAAYQSLGGFISSFADPLKTGCSFVEGKLVVDETFYETSPKPAKKKERRSSESTGEKETTGTNPEKKRQALEFRSKNSTKKSQDSCQNNPFQYDFSTMEFNWSDDEVSSTMASGPLTVATMDGRTRLHVDNSESTFNTFQYWRTPLPEVELDIDVDEGGKATAIHVRAKGPGDTKSEITVRIASEESGSDAKEKRDSGMSHIQVHTACINTFPVESDVVSESKHLESVNSSCQSKLLTFNNKKLVQVEETVNNTSVVAESNSSSSEEEESESLPSYDQDIVPAQLLFKYTSILGNRTVYHHNYTDKTIEYCAFSFPAVAYTLGRKHWPCIRSTCRELASHVKWSVRRVIASSLHELATILGHDLTVRDLLPIFIECLGEVDDVRIRLVAHLPQFLEQLSPSKRWYFLPSLTEFICLYNEKNWRFRSALAEQLQPTAELYSASEVYEYFLPVSLSLLQDRVSAVRIAAAEFMAAVIKILYKDEKTEQHCRTLLSELNTTYRRGKKWSSRQTYVFLCDQVAKKGSLPVETYVGEMLSNLLFLARDEVPNVRLAVIRCLSHTLCLTDYLRNLEGQCYIQLLDIVQFLRDDMDADVRHFACLFAKLHKEILIRQIGKEIQHEISKNQNCED